MTNAAVPNAPRHDAHAVTQRQCPDDLWTLGERAVARARRWADESSHEPTPRSAKLLSRILTDPAGLDFTTRFVDDVVRPADLDVASAALQRLSGGRTDFLPGALAAAMGLGSTASRLAPRTVTTVARRVFREIVGDLVVDATDKGLGPALARLRKGGNRLNVNLLGEAVLGEKEAARRLSEVSRLVTRDDVDYVSIKVSAVTGPHNPWGFEEVVAHGVSALLPLYRLARDSGTFLNLDMEDYKDLDLTIAVFTAILDQPDMKDYEAGIVLQAYLPDSLDALQRLHEWARTRVEAGGARIKVRIVKGANLSMETVDAQIHGWELTTWSSKQETDTNYKRMLAWAMTPECTRAIRLGVAGQNIFDIAFAYELRAARGVEDSVEFEMLAGMATGIQEVVRREVGSLLLYVPVVNPREFDVAISYLVRRLEENAAPENFMSGVFDIAADEDVFARERDRFLAALADLDPNGPAPVPNRTQNRLAEREHGVVAEQGDVAQQAWRPFVSEADSDPALAANRQWARDIAAAIPTSTLGVDAVRTGAQRLATNEQVDALVEASARAARSWQALDPKERAAALHRVGDVLAARRAELIEVAGSEAGKTIDQADPEVSEAIDFCHHYAAASLDLAREVRVAGARFVPVDVTVVASPWNFPVAIPVGGVAAALAAGSAVILKPAPPAKRCAAQLVRAFHDAGVPEELVALAPLEDGDVSRHLVTHTGVDRVVLTGSYDTARLFRSWKPDMHLLGETSGKNAIIVTPSADPDLAVRDVVQSAFAHAGQKCSASSLLILVGSAGHSDRIARQLVDAASSLRVGLPASLDSQVGPVVVPDDEKAVRGLTTLGAGEHWVLKPRHLGDGLWTPGIRAGVVPGSEFHLTEYFAPVLGVMRVDTLEEAIDAVNAVDYGLTSGLHTLDSDELALWLDGIEAGNLYVNRGITGAIVRRQPFGGWKRSAIGSTTKAGGPSYLLGLGEIEPVRDATVGADGTQGTASLAPGVLAVCEAVDALLSASERTELRRALNADADAWADVYGANRDVTGLACERNILRYRPTPVLLRAGSATPLVDIARVVAAGILAGGPIGMSVAEALPQSLLEVAQAAGVEVSVEDAHAWDARLAMVANSGGLGMRVRILGPSEETSRERWAHASRVAGGSPDLALYTGDVTPCPHSELLPFVREQAVSITNHRFGTPFDLAAHLL